MEFLTSGVFWTGLAGIVATAVTAVVGQVAQSGRHLRELHLRRRRHRYDELRESYDGVLDMMTRVTVSAFSRSLGDRVLGGESVEHFVTAVSALGRLKMVRAPQSVQDACKRYTELLPSDGDVDSLTDDEREALRSELRGAEDVFMRACAEHLLQVWPLDPKD